MCEKNTQTLIDTYFKSYNVKLHMEGNKEIFKNDFPDGWVIIDKQLFRDYNYKYKKRPHWRGLWAHNVRLNELTSTIWVKLLFELTV